MFEFEAVATVGPQSLAVRYEISNRSATEGFVNNRYTQDIFHPDSLDQKDYTTSSCNVALLTDHNLLMFQGTTPVPRGPRPYAWPQPAHTRLPIGGRTSGVISLRLPLQQAFNGNAACATGEVVQVGRVRLVVEVYHSPTEVQDLDGTDAVEIFSTSFFRCDKLLTLSAPIPVTRNPEREMDGEDLRQRLEGNIASWAIMGMRG